MSPKTEIGTVISVLKGARPEYQVRLKRGEIVIVGHAQLNPSRTTLLVKGSRLRVTHDLGRVQSASADLSVQQTGQVRSIDRRSGRPVYQVELEDGSQLQVSADKINPHLKRAVLIGAVLSVQMENEQVTQVSLVSERQPARVEKTDLSAGTVAVKGEAGDSISVRLERDILRGLHPGDRLVMEIHYSAQGERRVTLEKVAAPPPPRTPPAPTTGKPPAPPPTTASSQPPVLEAELSGVDLLYLEQRRKENHRPELMRFIEEHSRTELIEWYRMRAAKPARFAQPRQPLSTALDSAVRAADPVFKGFYTHQARALDSIRSGRSLVIVTPTASGKTLSYNPAIFERMCQEPQAHALYLFPLNALMTDQKEKIDALRSQLSRQKIDLTAELLVGGLGTERRKEIARQNPHLLATNPELLSVILDEAARQWQPFFAALKYVVVDEVHTYRGIFGIHMSGLVRRLLLTARRFGANPQFILSSATISNPLDLASRLTSLPEEDFDLIAEPDDGSQQACKHWAVLNPDWDSKSSRYDNYLNVAASAFVDLVTAKDAAGRWSPLNTILFAKSMREVNRLHKLVQENLRHRRPELAEKVFKYISAELNSQDKRTIYEGLRSGRLVGVVSTNALEAGIDIGKLDACVIAGFPFSVMSVRQMAGRVGRHQEGLVLYVPHPFSSLDQYYRDHPDLLLSQPPEVFVVDPHNPYIVRKHLNAAAFALAGLTSVDAQQVWGPGAQELLTQAVQDGVMRQTSGRYFGTRRDFNNAEDLYAVQSLRSNPQKPYAICPDDGQPCQMTGDCLNQSRRVCPRRIAAIDQALIYRDCHPGAIYESPSGKLYQITQFDDKARVARAQELPDSTLERTYAEEEVQVDIGAVSGSRSLRAGIELAWGPVVVTRSFTGYYTHTLLPARRCRRCRKEFDQGITHCPSCHRPTETVYNYSKPTRHDFPSPYQQGFSIVRKTVACWITLAPQLETRLEGASPCKLPGEKNGVLAWLKKPLNLDRLPKALRLTEAERTMLAVYHRQAGEALREAGPSPVEALLYPGLYRQCLLASLRAGLPESRALELFQAVSAYPVTDNLRHICRRCQTSALMPALHTLQHVVGMRYPSVALGDQSDLDSFVTLGHSGTGKPTIFWYDSYEGGLGAAEKIYEKLEALLEAGAQSMLDCACSTLEGCPRCTQLPGCETGNDGLSKAAALDLINLILDTKYSLGYRPFYYRPKRGEEFERAYQKNEFAAADHGLGEEAPAQAAPRLDPYQVLRLQTRVHARVLQKAFEARSREIAEEVPPLSAVDLSAAYQQASRGPLAESWQFNPKTNPYQAMEVLPSASTRMVQQIYRVIALEIHPDGHPDRQAWANEMMKLLNNAYETILAERKR